MHISVSKPAVTALDINIIIPITTDWFEVCLSTNFPINMRPDRPTDFGFVVLKKDQNGERCFYLERVGVRECFTERIDFEVT